MINIPILIPAYNPNNNLLDLLYEINSLGFNHIIVVNDGSSKDFKDIFEKIKLLKFCVLIEHEINLGKGRALKTGLEYIYSNVKKLGYPKGVVTADADGQHLPEDIVKIANAILDNNNNNKLILGVRVFSKGKIPLRSRIGNIITRYLVTFLLGKKITDTQTGLRGIYVNHIPLFLKISGEKYEYEMNMLIHTRKYNIGVLELPIHTVYIDNNSSSHFNPIFDSFRIYSLLFGSLIVALLSFGLDYIMFSIIMFYSKNLALSSYSSRAISMIFNYKVNKSMVFSHKGNHVVTIIKYFLLAFMSITISYLMVGFFSKKLYINVYAVKIVVEACLFIINFFIQNTLIFKNNSKH